MDTPAHNLRRNRRPTQRKIEADIQNSLTPSRNRKHPVEDSGSEAKQEDHSSHSNDAPIRESIPSLAGPSNHRPHQRERRDVDFTIFEDPIGEREEYENTSHKLASYHYEHPFDDDDEDNEDTSHMDYDGADYGGTEHEGASREATNQQDAALAAVATEDQIRQVRSVLAGQLDDRLLDEDLWLSAVGIYGARIWIRRYENDDAAEPPPPPAATGEEGPPDLRIMGRGDGDDTEVSPAPDFFEVSSSVQDLSTVEPTSSFFEEAFFFSDPPLP